MVTWAKKDGAIGWLGRVSMFITGFIMLTPHRIALTCAPHVLKRYHLPPDVVPLFMYKIHNPMELASFIGQLITNIIVWIVRATGAPKNVFRGISIGFGWTLFLSGVLSFVLFKSGGDYGDFNYFFWSIILMTFTNGWFSASTFKLEGFFASMYGAGLPASGFFTFFLHKSCKWLSKRNNWEDFDNSIVMIQFWVTVITLGITTTVWTVDIGQDIQNDDTKEDGNKGIDKLFIKNTGTPDKKNANNNDPPKDTGHAAEWSPIFMLACSLGTVYAIYPGISPYQLVDPDVGKRIDLWIQFTAAIPNFGVAILDIIDSESPGTKCGPSGKHWYNGKHGNSVEKRYGLWHLSWFAFIPYVLCIYIFISLMHFPDGFISRLINGNPIIIGFICNTFNFVQEWTESVGFAGAGSQGTREPIKSSTFNESEGLKNDFNDDIAAFNVLFMFTIMVSCMFTGYLKQTLLKLSTL